MTKGYQTPELEIYFMICDTSFTFSESLPYMGESAEEDLDIDGQGNVDAF